MEFWTVIDERCGTTELRDPFRPFEIKRQERPATPGGNPLKALAPPAKKGSEAPVEKKDTIDAGDPVD